MKRLRAIGWRTALALGAWTWSSCAPSGFRDETLIQEVRIIASSADTPYAAPGADVNVSVLAFDGRQQVQGFCPPIADAGADAASGGDAGTCNVFWLPFVCEDPPGDAYYACFAQLAGKGGADAGAGAGAGGDAEAPTDGGAGPGAGGLGKLGPGIDLTPFLPSGTTYRFKMPDDAVAAHTTPPGTDPYGLAILFNVACAGHLELLPIDPSNINPQTVPLGCFDANGNQLGPDNWVLGFTRVYSYPPDAGMTNANPVIQAVDIEGQEQLPLVQDPQIGLVAAKPFTSSRCTASNQSDCPHVHIGPVVPASSQESYTLNGSQTQEEIWADFYATFGKFDSAARLLYDVTRGSLGDAGVTNNQWMPPSDPGEGFIWMIVRDNRGGATWVTVPVHVQ